MPSLKEEILITVKAGILYFMNPYALFRVGLPYTPTSFYKSVSRLEKKGFVQKFKRGKNVYLQLTENGEAFLEEHRKAARKSSQHWDHRWRLVIFDIPEKKGELRTYFRRYLKTLGFGKVQRSVWISPYDLENKVKYFSEKLKISKYVFQLTVDKFKGLNEKELARTFWDIGKVDSKYTKFIQRYSEEFGQLKDRLRQSPGNESVLQRRFLGNLLWDYQTILAQDPHLPREFLPGHWAGKSARAFVTKCRSSFTENI